MSEVHITLDPQIKTHVLLPITIVMLLVHLLRQLSNVFLKPKQQLQTRGKVRESQHLQRLTMIGQNRNTVLCRSEWDSRNLQINDLYNKPTSLNKILEKPSTTKENKSGTSEFSNPFQQSGMNDTIMQGLKTNIINYLPQPVLMFYMSYLFRGYIALKLPFKLTSNFKPMFQSSIMTPDLDVSYVTGISWYFANLLGVESLGNLVSYVFGMKRLLSSPEDDLLENVSLLLGSGGLNQIQVAGLGTPKAVDTFKKNIDAIRMANYDPCIDNVQKRVVDSFK